MKGESGDDEKEDADDEDKERKDGRGRGRFRRYRPRYVRRGGKKVSGDEDGGITSGDEGDREVSVSPSLSCYEIYNYIFIPG